MKWSEKHYLAGEDFQARCVFSWKVCLKWEACWIPDNRCFPGGNCFPAWRYLLVEAFPHLVVFSGLKNLLSGNYFPVRKHKREVFYIREVFLSFKTFAGGKCYPFVSAFQLRSISHTEIVSQLGSFSQLQNVSQLGIFFQIRSITHG